jgi:hypothetical protein
MFQLVALIVKSCSAGGFCQKLCSIFPLCEEVEVPTEQVYKLHGQKTKDGGHQNRVAPIGTLDAGIQVHAEVQGEQWSDEHGDDARQLSGCSRCSSPVPAKTIPPERRSDLPSHAIGWMQQASTSQWDEGAFAACALERFGQTEWLETAAGTTGTRIVLTQTNDLLVEGELLVALVEHVNQPWLVG